MFRLSRLETATQEIIFVVTFFLSTSLVIGGGLYLLLNSDSLPLMAGKVGVLFFQGLFGQLGFAALLLGGGIFWLGNYLLPRTNSAQDVWRLAPNLLMFFIIQVLIVVMAASLLSVFQLYKEWQVTERLTYGAGGWLGLLLGGNLFRLFGLYGAIAFISAFSLVVGIASGLFEFLSLMLWIEGGLKNLFSKSLSLTVKGARSFFHVFSQPFSLQIVNYYRTKYRRGHDVTEYFRNSGSRVEIDKVDLHNSTSEESHESGVEDHSGFSLDSEADTHVNEHVFPDNEMRDQVDQEIERTNRKSSRTEKRRTKNVAAKIKEPLPEKSIKGKSTNKVEASHKLQEDEGREPTNENPTLLKNQIQIKKWTKKYRRPESNLLRKGQKKEVLSKEQVQKLSLFIEENLTAFQIKGKVVKAHVGVSLTMYEFQPEPGVKLSKISALGPDLALILGASSIRILTPIPGKTTVGIEVPNKEAQELLLGDLISALTKSKSSSPLPVALGKNVYGEVVVSEISEMPHLLVSGTTGSGKSVFINSLITGLLYSRTPKELRFLMIDPKMIELSPYNGIPHLLKPVITDVTEAKDALKWAEAEMDRRYQMFADLNSRNITSFNNKVKTSTKETAQRMAGQKFDWEWMSMPYIVIIVDELADLMLTQGKEVEIPITRIAQKARAAGIHLVLATQRPSAEIVTGLIKTNFPTRISFKVSSAIDSRTILDVAGAEKLLGRGDMLFMPNGKTIERIQGAFISEEEVKKVVQTIAPNK